MIYVLFTYLMFKYHTMQNENRFWRGLESWQSDQLSLSLVRKTVVTCEWFGCFICVQG